jgi:hypothetical protein
MRRLLRGFSRWGEREEPDFAYVAYLVIVGVLLVGGTVNGSVLPFGAIAGLSVLMAIARAWRLGA